MRQLYLSDRGGGCRVCATVAHIHNYMNIHDPSRRQRRNGVVLTQLNKVTHIYMYTILYGSGCVYDGGLMVNYGKTTHATYTRHTLYEPIPNLYTRGVF